MHGVITPEQVMTHRNHVVERAGRSEEVAGWKLSWIGRAAAALSSLESP